MFTARKVLLSAACISASAYGYFMPDYGTYGAPMSSFISSNTLSSQAGVSVANAGKHKPGSSASSTARVVSVYAPGQPLIAPRKLAASYPPASRAQAEQLFVKTLEGYREIETKFRIPPGDMAGALAAFVAGNYTAFRDEPFPDAHFRPLVQQMRGALEGVTGLSSASYAEKREMYESLAILGTYMALTREALQKSPDPKLKVSMQRAARTYLEQFLKIDPDRMRIGPQGLTVN
jgi:hypothetical protein